MSESVPFAVMTGPDLQAQGTFRPSKPLRIGPWFSNRKPFAGRVYVLINDSTKSRGEFFAMALKTVPHAKLIGARTAGADGNVSMVFLPGGLRVFYSGLGVYWPDGRETQRVGLTPDIEVLQTIAAVREGKDLVLERALVDAGAGN